MESFTVNAAAPTLMDLAKMFQSIVDENQSQPGYPDSSIEIFSRRRLEANMDRRAGPPADPGYDRYSQLLEDEANMWFGSISLGR